MTMNENLECGYASIEKEVTCLICGRKYKQREENRTVAICRECSTSRWYSGFFARVIGFCLVDCCDAGQVRQMRPERGEGPDDQAQGPGE